MYFKFVTAVIAAVFVIVAAQEDVDESYRLNPKFPEYAKLSKPEAPETPEAPNAPEGPEAPNKKYDAPETPKAPEMPQAPEGPKAPEGPEAPESPKAPEGPEAPESPKASEDPKAPESPDAPESPKEPETPEAPEKPKSQKYQKRELPEYETPKYEKPEMPEYEKPEYPKYEAPELPKYEAPEIPSYEPHELPKYEAPKYEFPEYEKPEVPMYEHPEAPEHKMAEEPKYDAPSYPSVHGYHHGFDYGYPHYGYYFYGHPDYSVDQPKEMEMKKMEEPEMKEEDKQMEEGEKMEDNAYGVPVFNFPHYEMPKIEEHNFDDFKYNLSDYGNKDENSSKSDYFPAQASQEVPVAKSYQPVYHYYPNEYGMPSNYAPEAKVEYNPVPSPAYPSEYPQYGKPDYADVHYPSVYPQNHGYQPATGSHQHHNVVEKEGSYYRLDTCEYRFILDMVQCHQEEHHSEKVKVQASGEGHHHQGQAPHYYNNDYYNYRFPFQAPYDSRYYDFMRLYGSPMYYADHAHGHGHSYKPGHFDDSLFSYSPSVGHPFYAPGLHNSPFAKYYAGFRAGKFEQGHEAETRQYHKEAHYQTALQDFNNLQLKNVAKVESESESSVKTSSQVSTSNEVGYKGVSPYFNYNVRLLPNHCSVPGYEGRHTCIVFSGATHPFKMVHRQFIYLKNSREVQGKYRFRYEDGQQVQY